MYKNTIATIEFIHPGLQPIHLVGCSLLGSGIQHSQTQQQARQEPFHADLTTVSKSCWMMPLVATTLLP